MRSNLFIVVLSLGVFTGTAAAQSGDKERDHRKPKARDHRKSPDAGSARKNEVVPARRGTPKESAPAPASKDQRKNEKVRAQRGQAPGKGEVGASGGNIDVRDHRNKGGKADDDSPRKNEVVPSETGNPPRRAPKVRDHRWKGQLQERPLVSSFAPRLGKSSTSVTIRGRNFQDGTVIKVNGQVIATQSVSANAVVFEAPKLEGQASITLSYPGAPSELVVGSFDFNAGGEAVDRKSLRNKRLKEAEARWKKRRAEIKFEKALEARVEARRQREAERAATRDQRREERLAKLRVAWEASFLADEQTTAELALHAQRKARLQRILQIAESLDKGKLVARVEISLEDEDQRHERRMGVLQANFKVQ